MRLILIEAANGSRVFAVAFCIAWLSASSVLAQEHKLPARPPELLWHDAAAIETNHRHVTSGEAAWQGAMDRLRADAEAALKQEPVTVTEKEFVPPGGTRHDYRSLGSYWWPNPNREGGLPYIRRDGKLNPEVNDPRHSDRPRLHRLVNDVETLGWAYLFHEDQRYAKHAAAMLRTFFLDEATRMTPRLRYAQAIPGHNDGRFIGLIDTRKLPVVLDMATVLQGSSAWTRDDHAALQAWVGRYLDWLTTHEFGKKAVAHPNNHGAWYDVQVASYASFLGREELLHEALSRAQRRIERHFQPDGSQPHELSRTRSFSYSVMNLEGFFLLARLGEGAGVDLWNHRDQRLRAGLDYLILHALKGKWPHEQITPPKLERMLPLLCEAARVYHDRRYTRLADEMFIAFREERARLLYGFTPPPAAADEPQQRDAE